MKIKIITVAPFPVGLGGTNRIMTYAKGFAEKNVQVTVVCMKPTENQEHIFNPSSFGNFEGIHYKYSSGNTVKSKNFIKRRFDNLKGVFVTAFDLLRERDIDAIIYYSSSTSRALLIFLISRLKRFTFLKEENELPVVYLKHMFVLQKILFQELHYLLFDGFLLMTNKIIQYFTEELKTSKPYLHVPMTVDFNRFSIKKRDSTERYIAYCGVLNNDKDGVDLLIDAFAAISKKYPDIKLYLIGEAASEDELSSYLDKIENYQLTKKVIITGRITKDNIPKLLCNAELLVLPRPNSIQAEGGFPTKLGEYLASGRPVVVTSVGEIPLYLADGINVYMADPGSVDSIIIKMEEILQNYTHALEVAQNGKKIALKHFNYQIQAEKIINFIESYK